MLKLIIAVILFSITFLSLATAEESYADKARAAALPSTGANDLQRYANDGDWRIRLVVARRQTTPANILVQLANDPKTDVRAALAHNLRAPRAALEPLVADSDESVRLSLAHCGYTPPDLLEKLLLDPSLEVRQQVVVNLNLPIKTLQKIAKQNSDLTDRAKTMLEQRRDEQ